MSQSGRPLLCNVHSQNAYFSGNGVCKRFRDNALMKHRSETVGHGIIYTVRRSDRRDRTVKISESVDSKGSDNEMRDGEEDASWKRSRAVKSEVIPEDKSLVNVLYICEVNNCGYKCEYSNK
jgi:hypothetical protein